MADKIEVKDIIDAEGISAAFKDLSNEINITGQSLTGAAKALQDVTNIIKQGNAAVSAYEAQTAKASKATKELTVEDAKSAIQKREATSAIKAQAEAQLYAADSIRGIQAQIKQLNAEYSKMDKSTRENSARGKELTATLLELRNKLNDVKMSAGDATSNIGRYEQSIKNAYNSMGQSISKIGDSMGDVGQNAKNVTNILINITNVFVNMGGRFKKTTADASSGLRNLNDGAKLLGNSTTKLGDNMLQAGTKSVKAGGMMAGIGKAINAGLSGSIGIILAIVAVFAGFISKLSFVKNIIAGVSAAFSALWANIGTIFKAWLNYLQIIWNAIKGIALLLTGQFSAAWDSFKEAGKNAGEAVDKIKGVASAIGDAAKAAYDFSKAQKEAFVQTNKLTDQINTIADGFGYLNVIMNDTTRSVNERHNAFLQLEKDTKKVYDLEVQRATIEENIAATELKNAEKLLINGEKTAEFLEKELAYLGKKKQLTDAVSNAGDYAAGKNQRYMQESVKMANESITSVERLNTAITKGIEKTANDAGATLQDLYGIAEQIEKRTANTAKELGKAIQKGTQGKIKAGDLFDEKGVLKTDEQIANIIENAEKRFGLAVEEIGLLTNAINILNKNNAIALQDQNRIIADTKKLTQEMAAADKTLLEQAIKRSEVLASEEGATRITPLREANEAALAENEKYYQNQKTLLLKAAEERANIAKMTGGEEGEEMILEKKKSNAALEQLEIDYQNNLKRIQGTEKTFTEARVKEFIKQQTDAYEEAELQILQIELDKKERLNSMYRAGLVDEDTRAKESVKIEKEKQRALVDLQLAALERQASIMPEGGEKNKVLKQIKDIKIALVDLDDVKLNKLALQFEKIASIAQDASTSISNAATASFEIAKNQHEATIKGYENELALLESKAAKEKERYEGNAIAQKAIDDQLAQSKLALEKKIAAEKKKQAQLDKAAALFNIAINTAVAITKVMANPLMIAVVSAIGALQLSAVATKPIPAYAKGTNFAEGGVSLVGEKGAELVHPRGSDAFVTPSTPTLMNIPRGSKVFTAEETKKIVGNGGVTVNVAPPKAETFINIDREGIKGIVKESHIITKRYY